MKRNRLREIHGDENCHICGYPKVGPGSDYCSYPHGMVPSEQIGESGMWTWETDGPDTNGIRNTGADK